VLRRGAVVAALESAQATGNGVMQLAMGG
jgi:hypothetical protein